MLTKEQKKQQVALGAEDIKKSQNLVFLDFTGVSIEELKKLKTELKKAGAKFKVFKKRLLKLAMKELGVEFDPTQFESQVGTIFTPGDLSSVAAQIYKFHKDTSKTKKNFKILGSYNLSEKSQLNPAEFTAIAKLPGREQLLGMVLGGATGPLRAFMYLVNELAKKSGQSQTVEQKA